MKIKRQLPGLANATNRISYNSCPVFVRTPHKNRRVAILEVHNRRLIILEMLLRRVATLEMEEAIHSFSTLQHRHRRVTTLEMLHRELVATEIQLI